MPLVVSNSSSSTAVAAVVQSSSNEAPNDQQPEQIEQASPASDKTAAPDSADTGHDKANKPVLVAINELSKYNKVRLGT